jgi:hypothetical protein
MHNNRPDTVIRDIAIKSACLIDVAIPNSHNLHFTITEKCQKDTDFKEELVRIWKVKMACALPLVPSTIGKIPDKLHASLKLLNLRPGL